MSKSVACAVSFSFDNNMHDACKGNVAWATCECFCHDIETMAELHAEWSLERKFCGSKLTFAEYLDEISVDY